KQALRIDPKCAGAQTGLGVTLYDAACADIWAAGRHDPENLRLAEPKRADLRRQALGRLRANLELTTKLLNDGTGVGRSPAAWQTDPALTSVRDPAALAKLPAADREPWQRFWADVAAGVAAD